MDRNYILSAYFLLAGIPLCYLAYKADKYFTKKEKANPDFEPKE